ncbi:MAG: hypothetical protein FJ276_03440 [Planctomycetes bacterium]|nr:hypothetical protein [Planctomycetota bacterium]
MLRAAKAPAPSRLCLVEVQRDVPAAHSRAVHATSLSLRYFFFAATFFLATFFLATFLTTFFFGAFLTTFFFGAAFFTTFFLATTASSVHTGPRRIPSRELPDCPKPPSRVPPTTRKPLHRLARSTWHPPAWRARATKTSVVAIPNLRFLRMNGISATSLRLLLTQVLVTRGFGSARGAMAPKAHNNRPDPAPRVAATACRRAPCRRRPNGRHRLAQRPHRSMMPVGD